MWDMCTEMNYFIRVKKIILYLFAYIEHIFKSLVQKEQLE